MTFDKVIELCTKFKISAHEMVFIYCKLNGNINALKQYIDASQNYSKERLTKLDDRGIIQILTNENEVITLNNIIVSPDFEKEIYADPQIALDEFWDNFYDYTQVNGNLFPARNIPKEDLLHIYTKVHKGDPSKHQNIVDALKWFKHTKLTTYNGKHIGPVALKKFMDSQYYDLLVDMMGSDDDDLQTLM